MLPCWAWAGQLYDSRYYQKNKKKWYWRVSLRAYFKLERLLNQPQYVTKIPTSFTWALSSSAFIACLDNVGNAAAVVRSLTVVQPLVQPWPSEPYLWFYWVNIGWHDPLQLNSNQNLKFQIPNSIALDIWAI